jgi:hypothetical protein
MYLLYIKKILVPPSSSKKNTNSPVRYSFDVFVDKNKTNGNSVSLDYMIEDIMPSIFEDVGSHVK